MKRLLLPGLLATLLLGSASACSQFATETVYITSSEALVSSCQNLGEVSAGKSTPSYEVKPALSDRARDKGGNYVLVSSDDARKGVAYKCGMPSVAKG